MAIALVSRPIDALARRAMWKIERRTGPLTFITSVEQAPPNIPLVVMDDLTATQLRELGIYPNIKMVRGYRFDLNDRILIPTYSPWMLAEGNMNLIPVVIRDIKFALSEHGKEAPVYPPLAWDTPPTEFRGWLDSAERSSFIAHDIETPNSKAGDEEEDPSYEILRISLADDKYRAISVPYVKPYINDLMKFLNEYQGERVGWNSHHFDDPREAYNSWPMGGRRVDSQQLWHYLNPHLPKALGFVSTFYDRVPEWKSIGSAQDSGQAGLYAAMDARQTAVNYVGIRDALRARVIKYAN